MQMAEKRMADDPHVWGELKGMNEHIKAILL
jgi:hypothetical protein